MNNNRILRSKSVDILKAICAFLIVCIHVPFPGTVGQYFTALTRIGVPIFFIITGYFYSDVKEKGREIRQIKKMAVFLFSANLIYLVWKSCYAAVSRSTDFFATLFTLKSLLKFLLFNESPMNGHLWYLGAVLYVLIIVYVMDKLNCGKGLYWISPILLLGDLVLGKYSLVLLNKEYSYILVRNFLFVGFPYFCIGRMVKEGMGQKISRNILWGLIILFSVTTLSERFILVSINMNATRDHYFSTTLLAVTVFLFTLKCDDTDKEKEKASTKVRVPGRQHFSDLLTTIGRKYSAWLYILHPIFISCIGVVANMMGVYNIYIFFAPIIVYVATIIFLIVMEKLKKILFLTIQRR